MFVFKSIHILNLIYESTLHNIKKNSLKKINVGSFMISQKLTNAYLRVIIILFALDAL